MSDIGNTEDTSKIGLALRGGGEGGGDNFAYVRRGRGGSMKNLQVRTRGEGGSEIGDFTA